MTVTEAASLQAGDRVVWKDPRTEQTHRDTVDSVAPGWVKTTTGYWFSGESMHLLQKVEKK